MGHKVFPERVLFYFHSTADEMSYKTDGPFVGEYFYQHVFYFSERLWQQDGNCKMGFQ